MRKIKLQNGVLFAALLASAAVNAQTAPGAPGAVPTWTQGNKEGVGTSATSNSRVWFTLQGGVLTEVYYPQLDSPSVRMLEFAVTDGKTVWLESKDMVKKIEWADESALIFRQSNREPEGRFTIEKTYVTDPQRDSLMIDVAFNAPNGYAIYAIYNPALKNAGYGETAYVQDDALIAQKENVASALVADIGFSHATNGFLGSGSDPYAELMLRGRFGARYARAENGNVVQAAQVPGPHFTLALGFGADPAAALANAHASLQRGFAAVRSEYAQGWAQYLRGLKPVSGSYAREFHLAAMVLKAHEDKTFAGAHVAAMSIPWGDAVRADLPYTGGYHLVWARDLYEIATALNAMGDHAAAERALNYLFTVQQRPDGSFPQNTWLDGRPYWAALQMDEVAYPAILAWQLGRTDADTWTRHVRPEAEFIIAHGPMTQEERWEEIGGYSPSTIAAEIAGLVCAAEVAKKNGASADAERYLSVADLWESSIEKWLVTTTGHLGGPLATQGYYMRMGDWTNPNDGYMLDVHNGGGVWDERDVVDAGFLEFVRLGIRRADDGAIERSLKVIDQTIRVETPNGPAFYRYNHDGYGETFFGGPWLGQGTGRLWPIFAGERGEYEVAHGRDATTYLDAMLHFANAGGMIPEQVWDRAESTPSRFMFGAGTGSATPLAWSMAQFIRLVVCAQEKRVVEQPDVVAERYLKSHR